jgi:hypothetical protein
MKIIVKYICLTYGENKFLLLSHLFLQAQQFIENHQSEVLRWLLIWHAVIWSSWNSQNRNDLIFVGGSSFVEYLVNRVKPLSWKWYLVKNPANSCFLYEWEVQPFLGWNR